MTKKKTRKNHVDAAADALKDLNMYYAIIALCENSLISTSREVSTQRIITICKTESARCLADFDRARDAALAG